MANLVVSVPSFTFSSPAPGTNPPSQNESVTSDGAPGTQINFAVSGTTSWLTVTPGAGTTPQSLIFAVNTAGLSPGTYTTTVVLTPS